MQAQGRLTAGHGQEYIGQDLRVQQRTVQGPGRVVDTVALAQGVQAVALAWVAGPGKNQRIGNRAQGCGQGRLGIQALQFSVNESHIKGSVVNDQFSTVDKRQKFLCHPVEGGFVREEFRSNTMHREGTGIDIPLRFYIFVKMASGESPIDQLHAANLNNSVTLADLQASSFRVQNDLPHQPLNPSIPLLARASASSFSGCPL